MARRSNIPIIDPNHSNGESLGPKYSPQKESEGDVFHLLAGVKENDAPERVLNTTAYQQLVVKSIDTEIGPKVHPLNDQLIVIVEGSARATVGTSNSQYFLRAGDSITIPAGKQHHIDNLLKSTPLKVFIVFSPPLLVPDSSNQ
jgi:mannose-6-phosphate isomerase-like protein (cupin superfamily)